MVEIACSDAAHREECVCLPIFQYPIRGVVFPMSHPVICDVPVGMFGRRPTEVHLNVDLRVKPFFLLRCEHTRP